MGEDFFAMGYAHGQRWPYTDRVQRTTYHPYTTIDRDESIMKEAIFCIGNFDFNAVSVAGFEYIQVLQHCLVCV